MWWWRVMTTTTMMQRFPTLVMAAWTCDEGCVASPCIDHGEVDTISANVGFAFVTCPFFSFFLICLHIITYLTLLKGKTRPCHRPCVLRQLQSPRRTRKWRRQCFLTSTRISTDMMSLTVTTKTSRTERVVSKARGAEVGVGGGVGRHNERVG